MNQEEQRESAIELKLLGACDFDGLVANDKQLIDYTAAIEAPLQARIARLENSLQLILDEVKYQAERGGWEDRFEIDVAKATLQDSDATWLSAHDKEVEAPLQARIAQLEREMLVLSVDSEKEIAEFKELLLKALDERDYFYNQVKNL